MDDVTCNADYIVALGGHDNIATAGADYIKGGGAATIDGVADRGTQLHTRSASKISPVPTANR